MDKEQGHAEYFRLPEGSWDDVGPDLLGELRELAATLHTVTDGRPDSETSIATTPTKIALECASIASRLLNAAMPDEADLRQVITTLRTALTVCWDMYGIEESRNTTVREHMDRLRSDIESFEADLVTLREQRTSDLSDQGDGT